ncbi:hypothetical protein B0H66DRAFT_526864 [Apodospora peruviana]|uniref:Uncharacterized protein n=1 Tax=Apodospora peruviana TaxID=516989 RepID=A0AAE0MEH5_9PEZI|nr:hypothetical protein B0H66DRAFT_526864 [Apodospora peruviana]
MSSPTSEEIRQLSEQAQPFIAERRPSTFLSLAPKTSDSYPRTQKTKDPKTPTLTADTLSEAAQQDDARVGTGLTKHRTSSLSSDGSKTRLRFLKLGPVHWGEHQDSDHQADFHEVAVEE